MSVENLKRSVLSIPITFETQEEIENEDTRFTKVKIYLMHTGLNLNDSVFEKSVIEDAMPTLGYISINGFIEETNEEKDFSDHRYIITKDENGVHRKYIGNAYGVVMSAADNNAHFEFRLADDGKTYEYLVVDGLIWNQFSDSKEIFERDLIKGQSMELDENSIEGYEDENGIFHFSKFSFKAACVLGDSHQPAMTGSTIEVVQFSLFDIQKEINDKIMTFTKLVNEKNQGGKAMAKTDFVQTVLEQFSDISNMVNQYEVTVDRWGYEVPRYYLKDIQENEIIVVDRKNSYQMYAFPFTMNGDKAEIDFTTGNRMKTMYVKYEEGSTEPEGAFDFGKHIAEIEEVAFTKVSEAETKVSEAETAKETAETNYTNIKTELDEMKPKYEEFVKAEQERLDKEIDAQKDAEFAKYESILSDNVEFVALKEKKADMTVKEIESECAILYARKNLANSNFTKNVNQPLTVGVMDEGEGEADFVVTKYGNIPVKR